MFQIQPDPIHLAGSGSSISKGGSVDQDPLLPNVAMIRIHVKMRWIRNAGSLIDE